ncbi:MAG TPA: hypothetical protein VK436_11705 [Methanocella sp.]|nr:hypothetical protein [Methanocella sp.]
MVEACDRLDKCPFVQVYGKDEKRKYAIIGFINAYCKGDKQGACIRKKVSKELGGPEKVPKNMMPTGLPISGTTVGEWPENVLNIVKGLIF